MATSVAKPPAEPLPASVASAAVLMQIGHMAVLP